MVEEFIWEKGISRICSSSGRESSNNTEGKVGGSGGKREGPQSDKMAIHTITGTTTITDTAEGTGWGLQTQPPSIPGHMEGWRERVEGGGRGWVSPADL